MGKFVDLTGKKFGHLLVIKRVENDKHNNARFECVCDCGNKSIVLGTSLTQGETRSCGKCKQPMNTKYSSYKNLPYWEEISTSYRAMKERCYRKNNSNYDRYGGRGIIVCNEWLGKNGRINFYNWAIENGYRKDLTIDRIDNNGNYEPSNCRWANIFEQANNKRNNLKITYNGKTKTLLQWSRIFGIKWVTLRYRILHGWDIEKALTTPAIIGRNQIGQSDRLSKQVGE